MCAGRRPARPRNVLHVLYHILHQIVLFYVNHGKMTRTLSVLKNKLILYWPAKIELFHCGQTGFIVHSMQFQFGHPDVQLA